MLTILAYMRYVSKPGLKPYLLVACIFALGLMAKPMLVTLPIVLLLLDYWPLGRFTSAGIRIFARLALEKLPLLALSAASSVITCVVQQQAGAVGSLRRFPLSTRIADAPEAYLTYIGRMFWPHGLATIYPHPGNSIAPLEVLLQALLLLA